MIDIDLQKVTLVLRLIKGRSFPSWSIKQSYCITNETHVDDNTKIVYVEILPEANVVDLRYFGKSNNDTILDETGKIIQDQSLKIENLFVNDIKIEILAIKDFLRFIPEYTPSRIEYADVNNIELPKELFTDHMFDNGDWSFEFQRPYFLWYNDILMNLINTSQTSIWVKRSHLGLPDKNTLTRLDWLLSKL